MRASKRKPDHVTVYDLTSGLGGSFTVSIKSENPDGTVTCRIWYGRAGPHGWEPWPEFDGYTVNAARSDLRNERRMALRRS